MDSEQNVIGEGPDDIHPERNIGNRFVAVSEFFSHQCFSAFLDARTTQSPRGIDWEGYRGLHRLGIVDEDGRLRKSSRFVRAYDRLLEYWNNTEGTNLPYLFDEPRAPVIERILRIGEHTISLRQLESETDVAKEELEKSLKPLRSAHLIYEVDGNPDTCYGINTGSELYARLQDVRQALLDQSDALVDVVLEFDD